jgi:hypothetical protein
MEVSVQVVSGMKISMANPSHLKIVRRSMVKTAEEIFALAGKKSQSALGQRDTINRLFRAQDNSNKWPVNGRYSVIERAIRHARKFEYDSGCTMDPLEYALFLEKDESRIVNDSNNW